MSLLQNSNAISSGGYNLESSLRFRGDASAYLERTPTTASNQKTWTWSGWIKRGKIGVAGYLFGSITGGTNSYLYFQTNDKLQFIHYPGTIAALYRTSRVFRDTSAWYHIVLAVDTTQATATDRIKLWVNGENTIDDYNNTIDLNTDTYVNGTYQHILGFTSTVTHDGYMTEVNFVDGQALTPSDFGETDTTTGVWKPKEYLGTYGTNGFYLPFKETQQATGFNTVLYTGNGGTQSISNVGFSPDFVWIKNRDVNYAPQVFDSVRGVTQALFTDRTNAENTDAQKLQSFDADGFTYGTNVGGNESGSKHVAWCWDAGSSTVSNTDGTITSSVRANPATGFSVVTYTGNATTGATVGHGLGTAPNMYIIKDRDGASNWVVFNDNLAANNNLYLNTTDAAFAAAGFAGMGATSSILQLPTGGINSTNNSGNKYVAYCFSEVAGYSKIGSYTGNGSTSGPTVTTGFRPAFVLIKNASTGGLSWVINDNTRGEGKDLSPNISDAESTPSPARLTFTDTGFNLISSANSVNQSGATHIYMAFADTRDAQFNFDASGNHNNWTANNINSNASSETTYDIMNDVPTLTDEDTANFATLNPLDTTTTSTPSFANLRTIYTSGVASRKSSIVMTTGKWYTEWDITGSGGGGGNFVIQTVGVVASTATSNSPTVSGVGYYSHGDGTNSYKFVSGVSSLYGTFWGNAGTYNLGAALDLDAGTITFYLNGVSQGAITLPANTSGWVFVNSSGTGTGTCTVDNNFGQRPFKYTPPTGYKKLNTYNLPDSTIKDGSQYFNPVIYTGNGSTNAIATGFSPDLVWLKNRGSAQDNTLFDSIRGTEYYLITNWTGAESTDGNSNHIAYDSNGFTLTGTNARTNASSNSYVAWNWKLTPDSGFDIATYVGNGVSNFFAHDLGVIPAMVIVKSRDGSRNWYVYHQGVSTSATASQNYYLNLNTTAAAVYNASNWIAVGTSGINLGLYSDVVGSGENYIAYCFAEVEGFSKFGSYTGNGSTDGAFVYTGFRPAFVLTKSATEARNWVIIDTTRDPNNLADQNLEPNTTNAEFTNADDMDILSNGFKMRTANPGANGNGQTIIYMAFAENPFKNSLAR